MNELRTLKEYTQDAKKIIIHKLGYSKRWMTDDNIAEVINKLVYADQHYDETKGSLNNWRYHSAMIAIKRIVAKKKKGPISLNHKMSSSKSTFFTPDYGLELSDFVEDKKQRIEDAPEIDVKTIVNHHCLTDLEKFYLREHFIEGKKQIQIAEERGVTNSAVSFKIIQAINKLKEAMHVKNQ